jgi:hypothetical protein
MPIPLGAPVGTRIGDEEHRRQLRRAIIASTVGTAIEWYDFILYGTVTGLVVARLYFPHADPMVGTLEAFGVAAVGFVARPEMDRDNLTPVGNTGFTMDAQAMAALLYGFATHAEYRAAVRKEFDGIRALSATT